MKRVAATGASFVRNGRPSPPGFSLTPWPGPAAEQHPVQATASIQPLPVLMPWPLLWHLQTHIRDVLQGRFCWQDWSGNCLDYTYGGHACLPALWIASVHLSLLKRRWTPEANHCSTSGRLAGDLVATSLSTGQSSELLTFRRRLDLHARLHVSTTSHARL